MIEHASRGDRLVTLLEAVADLTIVLADADGVVRAVSAGTPAIVPASALQPHV